MAWLEDELRESRATIAKLSQSLEQAQTRIGELAAYVRRVDDSVAAIVPQLAALPVLDDQLHGLKDLTGRVHEQSLITSSRTAEIARDVELLGARDRQTLNELAHRLDAVERQGQGTAMRFDHLEEGSRRAIEALTLMRQRSDEVGRSADALEARLARLADTGIRADHEFGRIGSELDSLRKQDEVISERVQVYTEMFKRLEGQIALVAADVAVKHDVGEKIDLQRVEMQRVEQRLSQLEAAFVGLHDRDGTLAEQITLTENLSRGFQSHLAQLTEDLTASRTSVSEQFQRLHQLQERLMRRHLEEMERDLRELRVHAFRIAEER